MTNTAPLADAHDQLVAAQSPVVAIAAVPALAQHEDDVADFFNTHNTLSFSAVLRKFGHLFAIIAAHGMSPNDPRNIERTNANQD